MAASGLLPGGFPVLRPFLFILPACFDTDPDGPSDNASALPWGSSFIEPAPDSAAIQSSAAGIELEMHAVVPETARQAISDHVDVLLAAAVRRHWQRDDPPQYQFDPATESDAYSMAGVAAIFQGSLSAAMWAFSQAVLSDPNDPFALNQLGWALIADGRYDEAKDVLLRALEIMPELWSAWSSLGYLYEKSGDWRRAEYCYRRALESHSESLFIHLKLGALLLQQGDINGAEYYAERALALSPDNQEAKDLAEQVEEQGGEVPPVQEPSGGVNSDAAKDVLHAINDCSDEQTQWMMNALVPYVSDSYKKDRGHEDNKILHGQEERECRQDCHTQPSDTWEDCETDCQTQYCMAMKSTIYQQYRDSLTFLHIRMGFHASYWSRYQSCAYGAIEAREHELSAREINFLIDYVDWQIALDEQTFSNAEEREYEFYLEQMNDLASSCNAPAVVEAMEDNSTEDQDDFLDTGIDACLDGFVCLNFGEGSIGFEVGVGVFSGGVTLS